VQAAGIVEALDILEQIASGIGAGSVNPVMNPLGLERVKEASSNCQAAFRPWLISRCR
jgi:hypothetical protein